MEPTKRQVTIATAFPKRPSNRLLFDCRYGWVLDEWKDPSEEALSGGRGMFCILPLTKAILKTVSQSINVAASLAVTVFERPDLISPGALQASLNKQVIKLKSSLLKTEGICIAPQGNSPKHIAALPLTSTE